VDPLHLGGFVHRLHVGPLDIGVAAPEGPDRSAPNANPTVSASASQIVTPREIQRSLMVVSFRPTRP
jgi:hypothetical protein